jgi:acetyl-CoA carboxylase biotin carboxylase subunit
MTRILIANRGEIAVRIIRTCKKMGYETVAIYSEADAGSLHCRMADYAACVGASELRNSYLNIDAILAVAVAYGVWAVHPGFGMLSENPAFRRACDKEGIVLYRPIGRHDRTVGQQDPRPGGAQAKRRAGHPRKQRAHPGHRGGIALAEEIGYPVLLKAASGGGGCGHAGGAPVVCVPHDVPHDRKRGHAGVWRQGSVHREIS